MYETIFTYVEFDPMFGDWTGEDGKDSYPIKMLVRDRDYINRVILVLNNIILLFIAT